MNDKEIKALLLLGDTLQKIANAIIEAATGEKGTIDLDGLTLSSKKFRKLKTKLENVKYDNDLAKIYSKFETLNKLQTVDIVKKEDDYKGFFNDVDKKAEIEGLKMESEEEKKRILLEKWRKKLSIQDEDEQ